MIRTLAQLLVEAGRVFIFLTSNISSSKSGEMANKLWSTFKKPSINWGNLPTLRNNWISNGVKAVGVTVGCGVLGAFALPVLGFGSGGVIAGSLAASWQGPAVAAGSVFATCQSLGATGLGTWMFGAAGAATGAGVSAFKWIYKYLK
ncbi:hypothetical protein MSG28_015028 [Choristoneura fumiferana]|uniref:Uncharacterized protein n=1 Tax=Choristoneura fumiferana TaxID=7141 RepID=A0ACC0KZA7_CHOFU|nr:hypothetical protein MSG28_015028 [Choristoneura fumiferana]